MVQPNSESGNVWGEVVSIDKFGRCQVKVPYLTFKPEDVWDGNTWADNCRGTYDDYEEDDGLEFIDPQDTML